MAVVIQGLVSEFETETGFSPSRIDVGIIDVSSIGDEQVKHVIGWVKTRFDL